MSTEPEIDDEGLKVVEAHIAAVRAAGLTEAADLFETIYWGWLRFTEAYVNGIPYVEKPEGNMKPYQGLHVTNFTFKHWGPLIPGTPKMDNEAVRQAAADDDEWHRQEDRAMRREAGESV
jgi:hypothetical protein